MIDFIKAWITDRFVIQRFIQRHAEGFFAGFNTTSGEVFEYPLKCTVAGFNIVVMSSSLLQISGSLHKYYTGGYNANDFTYSDLLVAVTRFCARFSCAPAEVQIKNLEFGVNITPQVNASTILHQVVCVKNKPPIRPYEDSSTRTYMEFKIGDYYVKMYDKGKQYRSETNILRFEVKAMRSRYLRSCGISTLADLMMVENLALLGVKINHVFKAVVFKDETINTDSLTGDDACLYFRMRDSSEWTSDNRRTTTDRRRGYRFRDIVESYGRLNLYELHEVISAKVSELLDLPDRLTFIPRVYPDNQPVSIGFC